MSTRCYNAYKLPTRITATPEKLMKFLNLVRKEYLEFLASRATADSAKWAISFVDDFLKNKRRKANYDGLEVGDELYFRQFLVDQSSTFERGMPLDCSGNCVIVSHMGTTILWTFPGFEFNTFIRGCRHFKRFARYDYSNQADGFPKPITEFWETLFDERKESIPSNLGLTYEFWRDDDAWDLARKFAKAYRESKK